MNGMRKFYIKLKKKDKNGTGCSICLDEIDEVTRIFLFAFLL
jgi:hypothetical protein